MPLSRKNKSKKAKATEVKEGEDSIDFREVQKFDNLSSPTITTLKEELGLFQVTIRVRKILRIEQKKGYDSIVSVSDGRYLTLENPTADEDVPSNHGKEKTFVFDHVFDDLRDTRYVYKRTVLPLAQKILEGYNGTVLAYGSETTGKTHTMIGTPEEPGLMYLVFRDLFDYQTQFEDVEFTMMLSFVEIHDEKIRDLMDEHSKTHELREDPQKGVVVHGISLHVIENMEGIMDILLNGNLRRQKNAKRQTITSSHSNAMLQIYVERRDRQQRYGSEIIFSKLNLVDLAGCENTHDRKSRSREGSGINRSLLSLSNCINALVEKRKFIPYRDSKLTRMLQNSMGKNCFTSMVFNVSPSMHMYEETNILLKFADRAKSIKLDKSISTRTEQLTVKDYAKIIVKLKSEVSDLREKLLDRVGTVDDAQKVGFGLTPTEIGELERLKESVQVKFRKIQELMARRHEVDEENCLKKIDIDAMKLEAELTGENVTRDSDYQYLEIRIKETREQSDSLKKEIRATNLELNVNHMDIRSKTVQELLASELSIMNATIEAQRFRYANEILTKAGNDLKQRLEEIGNSLTKKDKECTSNGDLLRNLKQQIEVIKADNAALHDGNTKAEATIRKSHNKQNKIGFWGNLDVNPATAESEIQEHLHGPDLTKWKDWNVQQVGKWLNSIEKLRQYTQFFMKNQVCGEDLEQINEEDLNSIGIKVVGHRKRFLRELAKLQERDFIPYFVHQHGDESSIYSSKISFGPGSPRSPRSPKILKQLIERPTPGAEPRKSISKVVQQEREQMAEEQVRHPNEIFYNHSSGVLNKLTYNTMLDEKNQKEESESFVEFEFEKEPHERSTKKYPEKIEGSVINSVSEVEIHKVNKISEPKNPEEDFLIEMKDIASRNVHFEDENENDLEKEKQKNEPLHLRLWTPTNVYSWLMENEISELICRAFIDSGVNGEGLINLTKEHLKNYNVQTEGMRRQIYNLIQMLKHKFGIHEAFTEPLPNFPEAIENFNFLVLSPLKKIRQRHIRMWIPGYNRARGKRVKWHMEVYPFGNNSQLGVRIGDVTSLSLVPALLDRVRFVVLLFRYNQFTDPDEQDYVDTLTKVLSTDEIAEKFWSKTVVGLDGGLSFLPDSNVHGLTQDLEHWYEFKHERVRQVTNLLKPCSRGQNVDIHVIEQDNTGFYSEDLQNMGEKVFRWPHLPDRKEKNGKDWRSIFILNIIKKQHQTVKRLVIACALHSPYILPKELEPLALKAVEGQIREEKRKYRDEGTGIRRIQLLRERLNMTLGDEAKEEEKPNVVIRSKPTQVKFSLVDDVATAPAVEKPAIRFRKIPPSIVQKDVKEDLPSEYAPTISDFTEESGFGIVGPDFAREVQKIREQEPPPEVYTISRMKEILSNQQEEKEKKTATLVEDFHRRNFEDAVSHISVDSTPTIIRKLNAIADGDERAMNMASASALLRKPRKNDIGHGATYETLGAYSETSQSLITDDTHYISERGDQQIRRNIYEDSDDEKADEVDNDPDEVMSTFTVPTTVITTSTLNAPSKNVIGATDREVVKEYKRRFLDIYSRFNMRMLHHVDTILKHEYGKEHELYRKLCNMYNIEPEAEWVRDSSQKMRDPIRSLSKPSSPNASFSRTIPSFKNYRKINLINKAPKRNSKNSNTIFE